jgi:hypothetical protein
MDPTRYSIIKLHAQLRDLVTQLIKNFNLVVDDSNTYVSSFKTIMLSAKNTLYFLQHEIVSPPVTSNITKIYNDLLELIVYFDIRLCENLNDQIENQICDKYLCFSEDVHEYIPNAKLVPCEPNDDNKDDIPLELFNEI